MKIKFVLHIAIFLIFFQDYVRAENCSRYWNPIAFAACTARNVAAHAEAVAREAAKRADDARKWAMKQAEEA
jgi:hypothetical protein